MHVKGGDAGEDAAALPSGAKEGAGRGALCLDDVVGVVAEGFTRREAWELAHDAISLHDHGGAIGLTHDPFAAKDVHGLRRAIVNGDVIHKGVRPIRRRMPRGIVNDIVHRDGQTIEGFEVHVRDFRR